MLGTVPCMGGTDQVPSQGIVCSLALDRTEIASGAPLLVRMALTNGGDEAVSLTQPISELYGTATVQIKRPGRDEFLDLQTRYWGLKEDLSYSSSLLQGQSMAAYSVLICDVHEEFVFSQPGKYELRARMSLSADQDVISTPVTIEVSPINARLQDRINAVRADLTQLSLHGALTPEQLQRLQRVLTDADQYETVLRFAEGFRGIHAGSSDQQREGAARLEQLRESGGPIWKELATAVLVRHYNNVGMHTKARQLQSKLRFRSRISGTDK